MTLFHMTVQAVAPAQTPSAPPIPALPQAPGAPTAAEAGQAAQPQGGSPSVVVPPPRNTDVFTTSTGLPVDPEAILRESQPIVGMAMVIVLAIFVGFPLVRMFARRVERRTELGAVRAQDLMPQIRQLQESVDAMALELERISEAQRFQAKLMAEKAPALPSRDAQG